MRKDLYRKQIDDCAVRAVQGAVRYKLAVAKYRRQQAQQALESAQSAMSLLPNSGESVEAFVSWLMRYPCLMDVLCLLSRAQSRLVLLPGRLGTFWQLSASCHQLVTTILHRCMCIKLRFCTVFYRIDCIR